MRGYQSDGRTIYFNNFSSTPLVAVSAVDLNDLSQSVLSHFENFS